MKKSIVKNIFVVALFSVFIVGGISCNNSAGGNSSVGSGSISGGSDIPAGWKAVPGKNIVMSDHEVTQKEWNDVMGDLDTRAKPPVERFGMGDSYPMYYVSWYDALVYCNTLSMKEGRTPCYSVNGKTNPADWVSVPTSSDATWNAVTCDLNANGYRLPTEDEWEYAAKGGENYTYSGSDDINEVAWYTNNSGDNGGTANRKTHPVKGKKPNKYGIYDMSGNVGEWCWPMDTTDSKVFSLGGAYASQASYCEVANRSAKTTPQTTNGNFGFRVVCR